MSVFSISKQRAEDIVGFLIREKIAYESQPIEYIDPQDIKDFNDTIEVMKSVFEALN